MIETTVDLKGLDFEWMKLIVEAKKMGIDKEEIREFLIKNGVKNLSI